MENLERKNWKLGKIIQLINDIHEKKCKKPSVIGPGFFGESGNIEEAMSQAMSNRESQRMSARQSARGGGFGDKVSDTKDPTTVEC